jgi:hypothetical protein
MGRSISPEAKAGDAAYSTSTGLNVRLISVPRKASGGYCVDVEVLEPAKEIMVSRWTEALCCLFEIDNQPPCEHGTVITPDGNGAYCRHCGETLA